MLYKTKAIILNSLKYGDGGIIVNAFTEVFGKQSYLIHNVRNKKSRLNANFFQPLSILRLEIYYKENRELQRVKEVEIICSPAFSHFNIRRTTIAMFLSEFLYRTLREFEPNKILFEFIDHSIQILEIAENGLENFHLVFLMQLTKFIGIYPGENAKLQQQDQKILALLEISLADTGKLKISRSERLELLNQLIDYYRIHLVDFGPIHSLSILQEVFQ